MKNSLFWKVALSIFCATVAVGNVFAQANFSDSSIGVLGEGSCWYETKESLKVASFNDKTAYTGNLGQIRDDLELILANTFKKNEKINELDLVLHCSGIGASLVAKVQTDSGSFCVWSKFKEGALVARSVGLVSEQSKGDLCDGRKWGEFILSSSSKEFLNELQSAKFNSMIKSVIPVSGTIYKVTVTKEFEFKEQDVINTIEENFTGKQVYKYIEFNEYRHAVGDWVHIR